MYPESSSRIINRVIINEVPCLLEIMPNERWHPSGRKESKGIRMPREMPSAKSGTSWNFVLLF